MACHSVDDELANHLKPSTPQSKRPGTPYRPDEKSAFTHTTCAARHNDRAVTKGNQSNVSTLRSDITAQHEAFRFTTKRRSTMFDTITGTAPSHWACYFINGMDDAEIAAADAFAEWMGGYIVDCEDTGFIHRHDAHQFYPFAADCQTFTALINKETQA
jgi:hypothetical protein